MKFYFHPDAEAEFDRAVQYYEQFQPGLGLEFTEEVYATITRIIQYPDAWSALSKNSRRCLVSRFPHGGKQFSSADALHAPMITDVQPKEEI